MSGEHDYGKRASKDTVDGRLREPFSVNSAQLQILHQAAEEAEHELENGEYVAWNSEFLAFVGAAGCEDPLQEQLEVASLQRARVALDRGDALSRVVGALGTRGLDVQKYRERPIPPGAAIQAILILAATPKVGHMAVGAILSAALDVERVVVDK